jgi:hypothetical protein
MHQDSTSFARRLVTPLAFMTVCSAVGCGGAEEDPMPQAKGEGTGTFTPDELAGIVADRSDYPYVMADGAVACGPGIVEGQPIEYYFFEKLNARLRGSEALAAEAAKRGVTRVDSCESARKVGESFRAIARLEDAEQDAEAALDESASELEAALPQASDEPVDKIADGTITLQNGVVQLRRHTTGSNYKLCSATLINKNWLLTAAHCVTGDGYFSNLFVYDQFGNRLDTSLTQVFRDPYWTGDPSDGDDIALIWSSWPWRAPADTSSSWMRVYGQQFPKGGVVNLYGYGASNYSGQNSGTLRRSNMSLTVDWSSANYLGFDTTTGEGRVCAGDSGGPAINSAGVIAGVASHFDQSVSGWWNDYQCPTPGYQFYYTQAGAGTWQNCATGGSGRRRSCWIQDTIATREGVNVCNRYTAAEGYTYLRCW